MPPLLSQNLLTSSSSSNPRFYTTLKLPNNCSNYLKPQRFRKSFTPSFGFAAFGAKAVKSKTAHQRIFPVNAVFDVEKSLESDQERSESIKFDALLSFIEFVCLGSLISLSVCYLVNYGVFKVAGKVVFGWWGNGVVVFQWVVSMIGAVVGVVIRRRQWMRICNVKIRGRSSGEVVSLVERIEKLEEDLRSSTNVVRVLSRQLEKLGIRFRVHKKSLKEPIAETATLAQKNSEVTRALAAQEDRLENELGEIQKVLLAMQEQQGKQLELILAIAKSGNLLESKKEPIQHQAPPTAVTSSAADGEFCC